MKAKHVIKNALLTSALVVILSMLPMFGSKVLAGSLPSGMSIKNAEGETATEGVDYEVTGTSSPYIIELKVPDLVISGSVELNNGTAPAYKIIISSDSSGSTDPLTYTIKDLQWTQRGPFFNFNKDVILKVEGNCSLYDCESTEPTIWADSCDLSIVPNSYNTQLSIVSSNGEGIKMSGQGNHKLELGHDSDDYEGQFLLSVNSYKLASLSGENDTLIINKKVSIEAISHNNKPYGAIENFSKYIFNGAVSAYNENGPALVLPENSSFETSSDNKLYFRTASSNGFGAILNNSSGAFDSYSEQMFGSDKNTDDESYFTEHVSFGNAGDSVLLSGGYAHSVLFKKVNKANVTFHDAAGIAYKTERVPVGGNVAAPEGPDDSIYGGEFKKWVWFKDGRFKEWDKLEDFNFNNPITKDTDIYSVYEYTVKFDSQGGSNVADQKVTTYYTMTWPKVPERGDYEFGGWFFDDDDYSTPVDFYVTHEAYQNAVGGIIKIKAKWYAPTYYTVTFDSKGGSPVESKKAAYGDIIDKPEDPVREGYKFAGWYTDAKYTTEFKFTENPVLEDITLYAKWIKNEEPSPEPKFEDPTETFGDVPKGKWYSKADGPIAYVVAYGIMNGTGDGKTFDPEGDCTREMFVQILYNSEGEPGAGSSNPFKDVKNGKWYYDAVTWALANDVTKGTSADTFGIGGKVTREQLAQFLMNYAKKRGYDTSARTDISKFPDNAKVSSWAKEAIFWANANGIVNGKAKNGANYLDPKGNATRAEVAQMIMNFQKKFGR